MATLEIAHRVALHERGAEEIQALEKHPAAWIATEGSTFNHVTERVTDIDRVAREQHQRATNEGAG